MGYLNLKLLWYILIFKTYLLTKKKAHIERNKKLGLYICLQHKQYHNLSNSIILIPRSYELYDHEYIMKFI